MGLTRRLEEVQDEETNESHVLKTTCILYGSIFAVVFPLHCLVRRRFPGVYNIRGWLPRLHCELAENQYGWVSWTWRLMMIPEEEFLEQCGMDALCLLRSLSQGLKLSLLGIFLSTWLLPIYATAPDSNETENIDDNVIELTIANVPDGSSRLIATVIASYLLFAFAAYLILQDFKWFIATRTKVLARREPRNYTVYVSNIPENLRSNIALTNYFRGIFSDDDVLEAHIALVIPNLERKVETRRILLEKLEHALAVKEVTGVAITHRTEIMGEVVDSIETYQQELEVLNQDISEAITRLEATSRTHLLRQARCINSWRQSRSVLNREISEEITSLDEAAKALPNDSSVASSKKQDESPCVLTSVLVGSYIDATKQDDLSGRSDGSSHSLSQGDRYQLEVDSASLQEREDGQEGNNVRSAVSAWSKKVIQKPAKVSEKSKAVGKKPSLTVSDQSKQFAKATKKVADVALETSKDITGLSFARDDGKPRPGGFVTFTKLSTVAASLQMVHTTIPFKLEVTAAPMQEAIVWSNVGRIHESVALGQLMSFAGTTAVCLFWTIPVTFILSISSVESLRERFDWLNDWIEKAPWLETLLQQLAPILLWLLGELLYLIMNVFVKWEGHVGKSFSESSQFNKYSVFEIIQNFFVASLAGSVTSALSLIDNPSGIVQYLAYTLPPQSTFFIQFMLAQTVLGLGFETLRVAQVWQERVRKRVGPNLTEKERNKKWSFLRPLGDPRNFFHARIFADTILFFMLTFVYTILSPLISYFLAFCFLAKMVAYRHQFVYIYPTNPDSQGRLWMSSIYFIVSCMLIAELTIGGYLVLKKAPVAAPLMIPLFIITCMFLHYIRQRHFRVAQHLSSEDCMHYDLIYTEEGKDFDFVRGKYRQPAMQNKELFPDKLPTVFSGGEPEQVSSTVEVQPDNETTKVEQSVVEEPVSEPTITTVQ